jgi:hypothetical protein
VVEDHRDDVRCRGVTDTKPHDLRGWAVKESKSAEVGILRHQDQVMILRVLPDVPIRRRVKVDIDDVQALEEGVAEWPRRCRDRF